ncbi:MAG: Hsp33 family molecular chaperone [Alphaproteobacteria bacterium]|nr:Hsp33 family molecular chaperone [Alphaproteobacteria bacterium]
MSISGITDPAAYAAGLTGDDIVTPFEIKPLGARGRTVRLGASITGLLAQHNYPDEVAAVLAEAIALTALLGTTLKFDGRFILQTQTDGAIDMMVVDFMTPGQIRAYARFDEDAVRNVAGDGPADASTYLGKGHLAMTVDQGSEMERYQGIVALDGVSLSEAAHGYFAQSEQIPTSVRLAAGRVMTPGASGGTEWRAGGILVQHLPSDGKSSPIELSAGDAPEGYEGDQLPEDDNWTRARVLMETTEDHELIDPQLTTDRLLYRLYHEDGATAYEPIPITCQCHCSRERISEVLRNFEPNELADTIKDGEITVSCEFCSTSYVFDPAEFAAS